jgi:hypothetical protein
MHFPLKVHYNNVKGTNQGDRGAMGITGWGNCKLRDIPALSKTGFDCKY